MCVFKCKKERLNIARSFLFFHLFSKMKWGGGDDFWKAGIALEKPMTKFSAGLCFVTNEIICEFVFFASVLFLPLSLSFSLLIHVGPYIYLLSVYVLCS